MKCFKDCYDMVKMLSPLTKNMIYQLHAMFRKKKDMYEKIFKRLTFFELFDKLGESLRVLVTLDILVHENKQFIPMWTMYNKMFIRARKQPELFG